MVAWLIYVWGMSIEFGNDRFINWKIHGWWIDRFYYYGFRKWSPRKPPSPKWIIIQSKFTNSTLIVNVVRVLCIICICMLNAYSMVPPEFEIIEWKGNENELGSKQKRIKKWLERASSNFCVIILLLPIHCWKGRKKVRWILERC